MYVTDHVELLHIVVVCFYTSSGKKNIIMNESHKSALYVQCFSLLSKLERTYSSLTLQLDTAAAIIEVSPAEVLRLRGNPENIQGQTFAITYEIRPMHRIFSGLTTYLSMKIIIFQFKVLT